MAGVKGRSGRLPKPTQLHIVEGTFRKDRHAKRAAQEPKVRGDGRLPQPPANLPAPVRDAWLEIARYVKHRIFTEEDVLALHTFARMWAQWKKAAADMDEFGWDESSERKDGSVAKAMATHTRIWLDLNGKLLQYFARFGMTPADRARVRELGGNDGKQAEPEDEFASK